VRSFEPLEGFRVRDARSKAVWVQAAPSITL
jgi:hypothetical protein